MAVRVGEPHPLAPSPSTGKGKRAVFPGVESTANAFGVATTVTGAALIVIAFFLPWVQGDGVFAMRVFSGFGLAGALHNISAGLTTSGAGGFAPMLFYGLPAGAVGVAMHSVLGGPSVATRVLSLGFGAFALAVVVCVLILSITPITDATRVLGAPSYGLGLTVLGAVILVAGSIGRSRRDGSR